MKDEEIIARLNENVEKIMARKEKNLMKPIKIVSVQEEAFPLGIENKPIFCLVEGLVKEENEGSLISNKDVVLYVDEITGDGRFVKLYLYGAAFEEYVTADEFKKDFFILC